MICTSIAARRFVRFVLCLALAALPIQAALRTAPAATFTTIAGGDWGSDGSNTPGVGPWDVAAGTPGNTFPISGDLATFNNHHITVSSPQVFSGGTLAIAAAQDPFLTLNSTLTMDAGTFTFSATALAVAYGNNGAWINNGTFDHASNQPFYWRGAGGGSVTFQNNSAMNFTGNGFWQMDAGPASIANAGTLTGSGGGGTINGGAAQWIANSGTIRGDGGTLRIRARLDDNGSGVIEAINGGLVTFDVATHVAGHTTLPTTLFQTDGNPASQIRLGGVISSLEGTISGNVVLQNPLAAGQALSYIDLSGGTLDWVGANANPTLTIASGRTFEFRSPIRHVGTGGFNLIQATDGTARNVAGNTMEFTEDNVFYVRATGGATVTFENHGTLDFQGSVGAGTNFNMDTETAVLVNDNLITATAGSGGTITAAAATQRIANSGTLRGDGATLRIRARLDDNGSGVIEAINGGLVTFDVATHVGGHTTLPTTLFQTDGNPASQIRLGGVISSLEGTISGNVVLQNPLAAGQTLSYIDLSGGTLDWVGANANPTLTIASGRTFEFRSPIRHVGTGGFNLIQATDGTARNVAGNTMEFTEDNIFYVRATGGAAVTFENHGTLDFQGSVGAGTNFNMDTETAVLVNDNLITATAGSGGTITAAAATQRIANSGTLRGDGATLRIRARLDDNGSGVIEAINGGLVTFDVATHVGGHTTLPTTLFQTDGNPASQIRLGGVISSLEGTISGNVVLQNVIVPGQALSYIDLDGGTLVWVGANINPAVNITTPGRILEFRSPVEYDGAGGYSVLQGDGVVRNAAGNTMEFTGGNVFYLRDGMTFENDGTLELTSGTLFLLDQNVGTFSNNGAIRVATGGLTTTINGVSALQTFDNQGVVTIDGTAANSTLTVSAATSLPQFDGANALTGGTWRVIATGTNTATLNLNPAPNGSITTIGAGAGVVLSRSLLGTVAFPQLGAIATLAGSLRVHDEMVLAVDPALTVTGTLAGDGTIVGSTITFSGGVLDPSALDGGPGTMVIFGDLVLSDTTQLLFDLNEPFITGGGVNDFVWVDGDLTLDGILQFNGSLAGGRYVLFQYTGELLGDLSLLLPGPQYVLDLSVNGEVAIFAVPEPTTWLMLVLGALGMPLASRRRSARRG